MADLNSIRILTGASSTISAAHRSRDGIMHGHTWQVTAWWSGNPDAIVKQTELQKYLTVFDHTILGDDIAWGEALAKSICIGMDCVKVEVSRPLEGLYAIAEKKGADA